MQRMLRAVTGLALGLSLCGVAGPAWSESTTTRSNQPTRATLPSCEEVELVVPSTAKVVSVRCQFTPDTVCLKSVSIVGVATSCVPVPPDDEASSQSSESSR